MSAALALISALAYGASDFVAGVMTKRASVLLVTVIGQSTAAAATFVALAFDSAAISTDAVLWGPLAGIGSMVGTVFLYLGLARGRMSLVAPLSAVFTAVGSALMGVVLGDRLTVLEIAGIASACAAIALVSSVPSAGTVGSSATVRSMAYSLGAGAGFALLFVALHRAGSASGLWPVAFTQSTSAFLAAVGTGVALAGGRLHLRSAKLVWPGALAAGVLGAIATITYFLATQRGLLSITAVIASLYPAATVALAVWLIRERVHRTQQLGLGLAVAAVALLAVR